MPLNKVFILTNPLNHEGGIVNYYNLFFKHFESKAINLKHGSIGSRAYLFYYPFLKGLLYPFFYIFDVLMFVFRLLIDRNIKIVQVSPSLIPVPLIRDGLLVLIAKTLGKKVVVFYRGWKLPTYNKIKSSERLKKAFNWLYQKDTLQVVLASAFKEDLLQLKPEDINEILVTTTAIDKSQILISEKRRDLNPIKVLFLGRIQNLKGIEELVEVIVLLKKENKLSNFNFSIVGHESKTGYTDSLKEKLKSHNISSQEAVFLGRVTGEAKYRLYADHDIYVLPSYTEGCPNSVLEALASGLFCITTRVGALQDVIIPKENGLFVEVKSYEDLHNALVYCIENKDFNKNRHLNAKQYSEAFDIKKITKIFEEKYIDLIENK